MREKLQILKADLFDEYKQQVKDDLRSLFDQLHDAEISGENFSFYTSVSSVFSSKIEGEDIELDSYIKHKKFGLEFQPDYTKKIDDLYDTYLFAQANELTKENVEKAHGLLGRNFVATHQQGKLRTQNMFVTTPDGRIEYVAAEPFLVFSEMEKFFSDIEVLLKEDLSIEEVFFFASMIHLVFVKIHPWIDGNGRTGRLLEKWFLAQKLGSKAWFIQSEKNYYENHQIYYNNLRVLGLEYSELDYKSALPFLKMLGDSI